MNIFRIIVGIGLIAEGLWLAIAQGKKLIDGKPNTLGGISGLLISGIGCIIVGIIMILKAVV